MTAAKTVKPARTVPPYFSCEWDLPVVAAVQALARGDATAEQQKLALDWVIVHAAGTYNETFIPEGERQSSFAQGRRFVGLQLVMLTRLSLNALRKAKPND